LKEGVLKKQSQFWKGQNTLKSYLKGIYEKIWSLGRRKNKAKQTQLLLALSIVRLLGVEKTKPIYRWS
jgi:hypothetical protein